MLTVERLRQVLIYDPATGVFRRRTTGKLAGCSVGGGYVRVGVDGGRYEASRLAWFYVHGVWPADLIDHVNLDPSDNRLCNLREATRSQNGANSPCSKNNRVGVKGVRRRGDRFQARIMAAGRLMSIGCYPTAEEAGRAYASAAERFFGEFARA